MSSLPDDKLLKKASHGGRNLSVLAILATITALCTLAGAILGKQIYIVPVCIAMVLFAAGYWTLALAAKRGSAVSLTIVVTLMTVQVVFVVVSTAVLAAMHGADRVASQGSGLIIPILILVCLAGNQRTLKEIHKRGLSAQAFPNARPTKTLTVAGGVVLALAFVVLNAGSIAVGAMAGKARAAEVAIAGGFLEMVQTEEAAFLSSLGVLKGEYTVEDIDACLYKLTLVQKRIADIQAKANGKGHLPGILKTYENATTHWKQGLTDMKQENADFQAINRRFGMADKLRQEAFQSYDSRFVE